MKKSDFFKGLARIFEEEKIEINENTNFDKLEGFDSMGLLALIEFIDENFQKQFSAQELAKIKVVKDLMEMIGYDKFK